MTLARHRPGDDVVGPVSVSASAVAPHRGDVTTVMAAAFLHRQAEERHEQARLRDGPRQPPATGVPVAAR